MAIAIFFLLLIYLAMILAVPIYAKIKGGSPIAWFFASLALTPFFALAMIRARERNKGQTKSKAESQKTPIKLQEKQKPTSDFSAIGGQIKTEEPALPPAVNSKANEENKIESSNKKPGLLSYLAAQEFISGSEQRIFIHPNIPREKLAKALKSNPIMQKMADMGRKIVLLGDDTLSRSGKDGILIDEIGQVSIKQAFSKPQLTRHIDLEREEMDFSLIRPEDIDAIMAAINEYKLDNQR